MEVGKTYTFDIRNIIDISGEDFYILVDPDHKKHLLPTIDYKHYSFKIGQNIECKVDKISCTGKIYLEPINPYYSIGKEYSFKFSRSFTEKNSFGDIEYHIEVSDHCGITHRLWIPDNFSDYQTGKEIRLVVAQIRKGRILLFIPSVYHHEKVYEQGTRVNFVVDGISTLIRRKEYYQLKDEIGQLHFLRIKHYSNRQMSKGSSFTGTIVAPHRPGSYYIEPEYPGYQVGEVYTFRFLNEEDYFHPTGKREHTWTVLDKQDKECHLFLPKNKLNGYDKENIKAKVDYIFKGKLFLRMA